MNFIYLVMVIALTSLSAAAQASIQIHLWPRSVDTSYLIFLFFLLPFGVFYILYRIGTHTRKSLLISIVSIVVGGLALIQIIYLDFSYYNPISNYNAEVTPVHVTAEVVDKACLKLDFPKVALQEVQEGVTTLVLLINQSSGNVENSKVIHSSGSRALDNAAAAGISKCKFVTASKDLVNYSLVSPRYSWTALQYVWKRDPTDASPMIPLPENKGSQLNARFGLISLPTIHDVDIPYIAT